MQLKRRLLVAAQPAAVVRLNAMLEEVFVLIPVYTSRDGFLALERDAGTIDLIICTVAFDESRMLDFLQAVKRYPSFSAIPFVCCRLLPSVLPHDSMIRLGQVCKYLGADEFLDLPGLDTLHGVDAGKTAFRTTMVQWAGSRNPPSSAP